jgi:hypothetical protein
MTILEAALHYALAGIPVFPVWPAVPLIGGGYVCGCGKIGCSSPAKHPHRAVPHGLKDATTNELRVRRFFENYPDANIGGAIGAGAIVAIDIDLRHDGELAVVEEMYGALPPTWHAHTGGGGSHYFFRTDAVINNSQGVLAKGVDVRARGGFVVLPPSLHISGQRYRWHNDEFPSRSSLAPLPERIAVALTKRPTNGAAGATTDWAGFAAREIAEGGRNAAITKLSGYLLRHYIDPFLALELAISWNEAHCIPPLPRDEIVRTVNSIAGIELRRRAQKK